MGVSPPHSHDAYAALKDVNYRRYATGFVSAAIGLQALGTAVGWEVYQRTHDPLHLGYTGLARALPVVLLALPAGHIADTFDRRTIVFIARLGFALAAGLLAVVSWMQGPLWMVYGLLALTGVARAFDGPARGSFLVTIVPMGIFQNAVAWTSSAFQFSAVLGPMLAGAMIDVSRAAWQVYLVSAIGNLLFALMVLGIRPLVRAESSGKYTPSAMLAGMSHLWKERTILAAITLDLLAVLLGGATALMPIFAKTLGEEAGISGEGGWVLGALRAAPFVGAFLMGVWIAHRPPTRRSGPALIWSVLGFGAATIVFGLSTNLWLSLGALFALGAVDNISVVIRHVLVQVRTPDHLRGRVGAVNSLFIECSNELGSFESGAVARLFGVVVSVVSGGIGTMLIAAGVAAGFPELRKLGELKEEAKGGDGMPISTANCPTCGAELPGLGDAQCPECSAAARDEGAGGGGCVVVR